MIELWLYTNAVTADCYSDDPRNIEPLYLNKNVFGPPPHICSHKSRRTQCLKRRNIGKYLTDFGKGFLQCDTKNMIYLWLRSTEWNTQQGRHGLLSLGQCFMLLCLLFIVQEKTNKQNAYLPWGSLAPWLDIYIKILTEFEWRLHNFLCFLILKKVFYPSDYENPRERHF